MNKNENELLFGNTNWLLLNFDAAYNCVAIDFYARMKASYVLSMRYNDAVVSKNPPNRHEAFGMLRQKSPTLFELKHISELRDDDVIENEYIFEATCCLVQHATNLSTIKFESEQEQIDYYMGWQVASEELICKASIISSKHLDSHPNGEPSYFVSAVTDVAGNGMIITVGFLSLGYKFDKSKLKKRKQDVPEGANELLDEIEGRGQQRPDLLSNINLN